MKKTKARVLHFSTSKQFSYASIQQKIAFALALALLLTFSITPRGYAQALPATDAADTSTQTYPYKKTFVISGYYSPLPDQSRYYRGTYEAELKLEGFGVHGADGTPVYPGMIAAPSTFPFGTKIDIPGLGVGTVHDRGGAIHGSRLDVWMGTGEEGLQRAFGWGMRTVEVTVYGPDSAVGENLKFDSVPLMTLSWIGTPARAQYFIDDLAIGDEGENVRTLQTYLQNLGFYTSDLTGKFDDATAKAVQAFQIQAGVITSAADSGAGNFGPRTRLAFEVLLTKTRQEKKSDLPQTSLELGDSGDTVMSVQKFLKENGFPVDVTGTFDEKTRQALIQFQIKNGVINSSSDAGSGFVGPKTLTAMRDAIDRTYTPSISSSPVLVVSSSDNTTTAAVVTDSQSPSEKSSAPAFTRALSPGDSGDDVQLLQQELTRLHFLGVDSTGYYGEVTQHAVFKFQQAFGLITNETDDGAGVVGPQTMNKLNSIVEARQNNEADIASVVEQKNLVAARISDEKQLFEDLQSPIVFTVNLAYGSRGEDVERAQKLLKRLGFFAGQFTTQYFGDVTKNAIVSFQKSHNVDPSGSIDSMTRNIMNQLLSYSQS